MDADMDDIDILVSDRERFNNFLYTPLATALGELEQRGHDPRIDAFLGKLDAGVPEQMREGKFAVLFRNVATPNHELRRFISIVEAIPGLTPVIIEYHEDNFLNRNECKFALGKICFNVGKSKNGSLIFTHKKIIDINDSNMRKLSDIKTQWDQRLIDFHHEFLKDEYLQNITTKVLHFDASDWIQKAGKDPKTYYKNFLSLFLKNAILFENFMLDQKELRFTKEVILPAFIEILKETGAKPLIVALEPTEIEGDSFWLSYPGTSMQYLENKLNGKKDSAIS